MDPLRVIIIDDTEDIHNNIKILFNPINTHSELESLSQEIFSNKSESNKISSNHFAVDIDSAFQGKEGFQKIKLAYENDNPYAVAVVDMRMPPGWDGLETIEHIRSIDKEIEIIISSAYSDYSWQDIADRLGATSQYLFLSKPFEVAEMKQMIISLGRKWMLDRQSKAHTEQLQQAQIMAEQAAKSKENFLSLINHELRTPLNVIIMTIEYLLGQSPVEDPGYVLNNAHIAAKSLTRVVDNIMYFIYLEADNKAFSPDEEFAIEELIHNLIQDLGPLLSTNVQLETDFRGKMSLLYMDRKRLYVALSQLLDNAIKFTDHGKIKITLSEEIYKDQKLLVINVADTGIGMCEEDIAKAFDLFYQGESINHHSRSGTGIGLSLCKKIVSSLDGTLSCQGAKGQGSTFEIRIPIKSRLVESA